uniref:Protein DETOXIFICATION n=1 Tax=Anthurium amnicola TaxID=1678845 RepID=A0A1D1Y1Y3_9ARAE
MTGGEQQELQVPLLADHHEWECGGGGGDEADVEEITSCGQFLAQAVEESKKLWHLAGPAIFGSVAHYSLYAVTQVFAGRLTTLELDAVSTAFTTIRGIAFGILMGMGSALQTLCGQAFGAKQRHMLGVYMQRSCVILTAICICLVPTYIFATPILQLLGQTEEIAVLAGTFSLYMIPELFACGLHVPMQMFLQAQSKVMALAWVTGVALLLHVALSWLLIVQFRLGLLGAVASLDVSGWVNVLGRLAYIVMGYCPGAWTGFSWEAFRDLSAFSRLSIAFAPMWCLEVWRHMFLLVMVGLLRNPEIAVAAISICTNLNGWETMVFFGFNTAISVRISNELGAGRPRAAKFSILVMVLSSALLGFLCMALVLAFRDVYALPFTNSPEVARADSDLAVLFSLTMLLSSIQPILTGVAVGAGWQSLVAYINVGCYYVVGLPLAYALGSYFDMGVQGIWSGMTAGVLLQTLVLTGITLCTNWSKEAAEANLWVKKWRGSVDN